MPAKAETRTIVIPDNYSTIEAAIANANNGDILFLRKGTYEGPINQTLVIGKTLSILGESREGTTIKLHPAYNSSWILTAQFFSYTDAITITADAFRLNNLTIVIASPGGYISAIGNEIQIAGSNITTGSSTGVAINGSYCKITDNVMDGFVHLNGTFNEVARNSLYNIYTEGSFNFIKNNTCQCLWVANSTNNVFLGNKVSTDSRSYSGVDLTWSHNNFFYKNRLSGFSSGFRLWFSSGNIIMANTIADSLHASISLGGSSDNRIYLNNFVDNMFEFSPYVYDDYTDPNYRSSFSSMAASVNVWDNGSFGNYWANYNGTDANVDGVGDSPYTIKQIVYDRNQSKLDFICGQDNFPFMARIDIDNVIIQLPEWISNLPLEPQPIQPQIKEPISQEPESATPSLNPSPEPQESESEQSLPFPVVPVVAASAVVVAVVGAGLLVYLKKRHKKAAD